MKNKAAISLIFDLRSKAIAALFLIPYCHQYPSKLTSPTPSYCLCSTWNMAPTRLESAICDSSAHLIIVSDINLERESVVVEIMQIDLVCDVCLSMIIISLMFI